MTAEMAMMWDCVAQFDSTTYGYNEAADGCGNGNGGGNGYFDGFGDGYGCGDGFNSGNGYGGGEPRDYKQPPTILLEIRQ